MLEALNLNIAVENRSLLTNFSSTFKPGEVWGILGANGCGKTTLLHTLAGIRKPTSGEIRINRSTINFLRSHERAKLIALLAQETTFAFPSSVMETALTGRFPHHRHGLTYSEEDKLFTEKILSKTNLFPLRERSNKNLSGGEKRKLMIAMLLVQDPQIFLLDEPTNHLDIQQKVEILELLKQLAVEENRLIIMTLHDIHLISHYCDHVILFDRDNQVMQGSREEMLQPAILQKLFKPEIFQQYSNYLM